MTDTETPSRARTIGRGHWVAAAAVFSAGAGLVHASSAGQHAEHTVLATLFALAAAAQIGWALVAFARPSRTVVEVGVVLQFACIGFWALTRLVAVSFIDGLETVQPVGRQDALVVVLEATALVLAAVALRAAPASSPTSKSYALVLGLTGVIAIALAVPASATPHAHEEGEAGHTHGEAAHTHASVGHSNASGAHAHTEPVPYDPTKPIDLGGTPGVTPEQQATAENIVAATLRGLPQWADPAVAEAAGFHSIGDGRSGVEHFVNEAFMNDDVTLDPNRPESLVYDTTGGGRRLAAAMYMEARGLPLEDVPDLGGDLMQWHTHENLCFNAEGHVAGLTDASGNCAAGLDKPVPTPMIHVWIEKNPCGPFAALEGIGGGRIPDGETKLCDHAHGAS